MVEKVWSVSPWGKVHSSHMPANATRRPPGDGERQFAIWVIPPFIVGIRGDEITSCFEGGFKHRRGRDRLTPSVDWFPCAFQNPGEGWDQSPLQHVQVAFACHAVQPHDGGVSRRGKVPRWFEGRNRGHCFEHPGDKIWRDVARLTSACDDVGSAPLRSRPLVRDTHRCSSGTVNAEQKERLRRPRAVPTRSAAWPRQQRQSRVAT
jgi:hypothetical protein